MVMLIDLGFESGDAGRLSSCHPWAGRAWQDHHRELLKLNALDAGLRLIVREGP
jgi:hypothetical protein